MSISLLLVGAGGELGQILLQELIRQKSAFGTIAVLAATKEKAATYASAESQGIKVVIGSFLHASSYTGTVPPPYTPPLSTPLMPHPGFTHVVSALGAAAMRLQPAMIDAAVAGGIRNFFPSEYNSDISQKAIYTMRYFRDKHVTRTHLRLKAKEVPGFTYTILVTGVFTEWAVLEFYGFDHAKGLVEAYGRPDARASVTSIPEFVAPFSLPLLCGGWWVHADGVGQYCEVHGLVVVVAVRADDCVGLGAHDPCPGSECYV